jgi:ubiquinone/menaquinone biosynthesis C-methylase UbiE
MSTLPAARPYSPTLAFADEPQRLASSPGQAARPSEARDDIPAYLQIHYWWAYIHPAGVRLFERQWLVNLILWGNYARLCDAALAELGEALPGRTLQVACVYGDLTSRIGRRAAAAGGTLDVIDVLPIQLQNLRDKLPAEAPARLLAMDSTRMELPAGTYDRALVFFLLHEQPADERRQTLREVFRVVKPGGKVVIVDYARPHWWNPLRYLWRPVLAILEPFALDLWHDDISAWTPPSSAARMKSQRLSGGLYQVVTAVKRAV